MDFAVRHFRLAQPDPHQKDKTRLQVLMDIREATGIEAPELRDIQCCPAATRHVWRWFCDMSRARTVGMAVNPITWPEMSAYFELMQIRPQPWEIEAIKRVDDAFLDRDRLKDRAASAGGLKAMLSHG